MRIVETLMEAQPDFDNPSAWHKRQHRLYKYRDLPIN